nr:peptide ABC transporter substrate-binding protein [Armatimonas sp.]
MTSSNLTRRGFCALTLSLVSLALVGCPSGNSGGGTASGGGTGSVPGVLRYPIATEPSTLDPHRAQDGPTIDLLQNAHMGLVGWNDKTEVTPLAAKELPKVSADGKVYTFTLRAGLKFHNGREVTADDVKYSLTRALDPKLASPVAVTYLDDIQGAKELAAGKATELTGVKVIDKSTIEITLVGSRPYFLGKFTYPTAYILAKEEIEKGPTLPSGAKTIGSENAAAVGCGAFKLTNYTPQKSVTLEANKDWVLGAPKLTKIERPIILDTKTARLQYDSGLVDIIALEKGDYEKDKTDPKYAGQVQTFNRASTYYVGMNQKAYAPFKNAKVRQAFACATNKAEIKKGVLLDVNTAAECIVPEGMPGYDANFKGYAYDEAKAKALLAEAGFPDGKGLPPLTLCFRQQQPDIVKTAQVLKEQWSKIGIPVELREMEYASLINAMDRDEVVYFHRWGADYPDPQNYLSLLLTTTGAENHVGYSNPAYDALCAQADVEVDSKKRMELYAKAQRMVVDDAAWIPVYYQRDMELIKTHVTGLKDGLLGHLPLVTVEVK